MKFLDNYIKWVTGKRVPWYEFWDMRSGIFGGLVMACAIYIVVHVIAACFVAWK